MPVIERDPLPRVPLETTEQLSSWLENNHATSRGIWLVSWRPATGRPRIPYDDLVNLCLCYGWIDSTVQSFDEQRGGMRLTPRKRGSVWSATNKRRLAELGERILAPGRAVIEAAKADGSYYLLDDAEALIIPDDLQEALGEHATEFQNLTPGRQKRALFWLAMAKRPATRAARISTIAEAAAHGESVF